VCQMSSVSVITLERESSQSPSASRAAISSAGVSPTGVSSAATLPRAPLPRARFERIFAEQHAVVWRMLRRFGLPSEKAARGTQWVFAQASDELARCAPGRERALLLAMGLRLLDAHRQSEARASRVQRKGEVEVPSAEPGHSGVVHAAPLRSTSAPSEMMDRVLLRMTRASATVFFLFELEGLGLGEASRVMGVDEASASDLLMQARQEFRAIAAELNEAMRRE
jgi:DNA-directed RNA polymerase specialized sigma24 family protein